MPFFLNKELCPNCESLLTSFFLSGFRILTFGHDFSRLLNLSVVLMKMLFALDLSFSAAVHALVEA
jgi:hypothetical protein